MFNPGLNEDDCQIAWKRHACRKVYYVFLSYFEKIRTVRQSLQSSDYLDSEEHVAFNADYISVASLKKTFAKLFLIREYDGDYPLDEEDAVMYKNLPIVFCTNSKTPRYGKSMYVRELKLSIRGIDGPAQVGPPTSTAQFGTIDNNVLPVNPGTSTSTGVVSASTGAVSRSSRGIGSEGHVSQVPNISHSNPVWWMFMEQSAVQEITTKYCSKANYNESFLKTGNSASITAVFFIRAYLHVMCLQSINGRNWATTTGGCYSNYDKMGEIVIYEDSYTLKHLYHGESEWRTTCKNYSNKFFLSFYKNCMAALTPENFFDTWLSILEKKKAAGTASCCLVLKQIKAELGENHIHFAELFLYSYNNEQRPPPSSENYMFQFFNAEHIELNQLLHRCNSRTEWEGCVGLAVQDHCCSRTFVNCVFKTRILWCYNLKIAKELIELGRGNEVASYFVKENSYYRVGHEAFQMLAN